MDLKEVVYRLETMAPLNLADSWDNVGLLIEPSAPHKVERCLLTNDLTEPVMQEALARKVLVLFTSDCLPQNVPCLASFQTNMIISYHPPVFAPLKRITQKNWKQRLVSLNATIFSFPFPHLKFLCFDFDVAGTTQVTMSLENRIAVFSPHTCYDAMVYHFFISKLFFSDTKINTWP